jgi:hypothetical protein
MAATALTTVAVLGVAAAQTDPLCTTQKVLSGSNFEIDTNANLIVNDAQCIDWLTGGTDTGFRSGVAAKNDTASGANDESFGQGTAEDNPNPTIVDGSIPPNKSDLKAFGVFEENDEFLELFWSRVQNPSGTTNMDFELNKEFCDGTATHCAQNGTSKNPLFVTPKRTDGDVLISYDLSKGGTIPTISIRFWDGTANEWGPADVISDGANPDALGSVNTSLIPSNQTGGATGGLTTALGQQDPFTFGEAAISFDALFGQGACGQFGSAYLKSRSSDSFTAEIKDFVPPEKVDIGNCPTSLTTDASNNGTASEPAQTLGGSISDQASLPTTGPIVGSDGKIEFRLYGPFTAATKPDSADDCTAANQVTTYGTNGVGTTNVVNHHVTGAGNTDNPYTSPTFTPTAVGIYQWTAKYVPDAGQGLDPSAEIGCGTAVEQSVVANAPSQVTSAQSWTPKDSATIVGHGGGTVTFTLLKGVNETDCLTPPAGGYPAGSVIYTSNAVTVPAGNTSQTVSTDDATTQPGPISTTAATGDQYRWKVAYSGTTGFDPATFCKETTALNITNS